LWFIEKNGCERGCLVEPPIVFRYIEKQAQQQKKKEKKVTFY
jgi:hypothetical protein